MSKYSKSQRVSIVFGLCFHNFHFGCYKEGSVESRSMKFIKQRFSIQGKCQQLHLKRTTVCPWEQMYVKSYLHINCTSLYISHLVMWKKTLYIFIFCAFFLHPLILNMVPNAGKVTEITCDQWQVLIVCVKLNQKYQKIGEYIRDTQKHKEIFEHSMPDLRILFWCLTGLLILSYIFLYSLQ